MAKAKDPPNDEQDRSGAGAYDSEMDPHVSWPQSFVSFSPPNLWDILIGIAVTALSVWIGAALALRSERSSLKRDQLGQDREVGRVEVRAARKRDNFILGMMALNSVNAPWLEADRERDGIHLPEATLDRLRAWRDELIVPKSQQAVADWVGNQVDRFIARKDVLNSDSGAYAAQESQILGSTVNEALDAYVEGRRMESWFESH